MIQILCDKCKKSCGLNAYVISINVIHNPNPTNYKDTGDVRLTDDNTYVRFCLCQECYANLRLPNIYRLVTNGFDWRVDNAE